MRYHITGIIEYYPPSRDEPCEMTVNHISTDLANEHEAIAQAFTWKCKTANVKPHQAMWKGEPAVEALGDQMLPGFDEGA